MGGRCVWQNDRVLLRIRLSRKKADLQRLVEEKARLVKAHKKEEVRTPHSTHHGHGRGDVLTLPLCCAVSKVFDCSKRLKAVKREMELLHCQLGGAATWCPHCLWKPTY